MSNDEEQCLEKKHDFEYVKWLFSESIKKFQSLEGASP